LVYIIDDESIYVIQKFFADEQLAEFSVLFMDQLTVADSQYE